MNDNTVNVLITMMDLRRTNDLAERIEWGTLLVAYMKIGFQLWQHWGLQMRGQKTSQHVSAAFI